MKPYYQTHSAGWLFLFLVIAFFGMEIIQFFRQREWRKNATRVATPVFWVGVAVWTIVATVMLHWGARLAPKAGMGDGVTVFAVGMLLFAAGAALRWASFWALGQYFTFTVDVSADQVSGGPSGEEIHADGSHQRLGELVVDQWAIGLGGDGSGCRDHSRGCPYAGRQVPSVVVGARHACSFGSSGRT